MDPAAALGDVHVPHASGSHLLLGVPRRTEHSVRMRIDQPGHEHAPAAIDSFSVRMCSREFVVRPHGGDRFALNHHTTGGDDCRVTHFPSPAAARCSGAGNELARVMEEEHVRVLPV
jgi:hypothetical protein